MKVWPIGISPSHLSHYWPTWAAAVHRRGGYRPPTQLDADAYRLALYLWLTRHGLLPADGQDVAVWRRPPLFVEYPPTTEQVPARLDLHWPSDEPPDTPEIVVVDRIIREHYPVSGEFIDLLY